MKPEIREEIIEYLLSIDQLEDIMPIYEEILSLESYNPKSGKTKTQFEMELCEFISKFPEKCFKMKSNPVDILRKTIQKDQNGVVWTFLAEFFIRQGQFGLARDIFEESLEVGVKTVRDFTIVFNCYIKFEQQIMLFEEEIEESKTQDEFKYFRIESLLARRQFLLSEVVLSQNPNDISQWLSRIEMEEISQKPLVFARAIQEIDGLSAINGKYSDIWIGFASYFERLGDLENSNIVYQKATLTEFKNYEELSNIFTSWAEMHVRNGNLGSAISIMKFATEKKLTKNIKCWHFYIDLLENVPDNENEIRGAYTKMIDQKIATPYTILNFTQYLQKNSFFEESFRIFERAIEQFPWPHKYEIWISYLSLIVSRFRDTKIERTRELFAKCLRSLPTGDGKKGKIPAQGKIFYLMFADFEEKHGLISHAMQIYDSALRDIGEKDEKFEIFNLQLAKASKYFGVTHSRQLFEKAFQIMDGTYLTQIGLRFAKMERKLGEIDRARGVYHHLSQFCNPNGGNPQNKIFWQIFEKFEVHNGDQDNYQDFVRIKKTVELRFGSVATLEIPQAEVEFVKASEEN